MKNLINNSIKHQILLSITNRLIELDHNPKSPIDFYQLKNRMGIPDNPHQKYFRFTRNINYLAAEDYIILSEMLNKTCNITLTSKGISACSSEYFINENDKIISKTLKEIILLTCNVIVAITAVIAIRINSDSEKKEIQTLKAQLDSVSMQLQRVDSAQKKINKKEPLKLDTLNVKVLK